MEPINIKTVLQYSVTAMMIFLIAGFLGYTNGVASVQLHTDKVTGQVQIKEVHAVQTYERYKTTQVDPIATQGPFVRALVLIILNAVVGFSIMLTGPILARLFRIWFGSIFLLAYNGYGIGELCFVISKLIGLRVTLLSILLHGIFELTAAFLCAGVGLFMGYSILVDQCKEPNFHDYNETIVVLYNEMMGSIKFYFKFILPMFIIAGLIEIFISSRLISWLIVNKGAI